MENQELLQLVKRISLDFFNREFKHDASFNPRLKTTGGRYHLKTHHLDFNPKIVKYFPTTVLEGIIKHELCHYHLHLTNQGYRHQDTDFKKLLKEVGGLRYMPSIEKQMGEMCRWVYSCHRCHIKVYRQRRFNTKHYRCRECEGVFVLEGRTKIKIN